MLPSRSFKEQHSGCGLTHVSADAEPTAGKCIMPEVKITFDDANDYECFMGAWSRSVGEQFLAWFAPPRDARWLDVGCGTGAFSELILRHAAPQSVVGIDTSPE